MSRDSQDREDGDGDSGLSGVTLAGDANQDTGETASPTGGDEAKPGTSPRPGGVCAYRPAAPRLTRGRTSRGSPSHPRRAGRFQTYRLAGARSSFSVPSVRSTSLKPWRS